MKYEHVSIEAFGVALPERTVSSLELEAKLKPTYDRIGLREGRLELMSGIRERRFWAAGVLPSEAAARAGRQAMAKAQLAPEEVGALLFCSVSRDFAEPATSTVVHRLLGMGSQTMNFDISNACLGAVSGIVTLANMVELGQIEAGLVVCGENGEPLVETTIRALNDDPTADRRRMKGQFASLTIGSAAAAVVVRRLEKSRFGHRLLGGACVANCACNGLCQGDVKGGMTSKSAPVMTTDSSALLQEGVNVAADMWRQLCTELEWTSRTPDVVCTHQVGKAHRELLFQRLGLDETADFSVFERFGNCGSASLPLACALAEEAGRLHRGDKLAMLGIGSGINCMGLGVEW